jgi:hypothetical protein
MAIQLAFNFFDAEEPETNAAADSDRLHNLRFEGIARMIADRHAPIWMISRRIAREMANTIKHSKMPVKPFQHRGPQVELNSRMKALRNLQRTLMESEGLSKRDQLDLDGPKFRFFLAEIVRLFEQALRDAGADRIQVERVMARFDALLEENDETLRRDLNMIGAPEMRADDMRVLPPVLHGVECLAISQQQSA